MAIAHSGERDKTDTALLAAALAYAARGWRVFPLHSLARSGGCDCQRADCMSVAKHPWTRNGFKDASDDEATIRAWWRKWPRANVGVATGALSGLVVLDVDPRHGGDAALFDLELRHDELPTTHESLTGGGGRHLLYAHPGAGHHLPKVERLDGLDGLDVRADGGYIVAPPSLHVSGAFYAWADDAPLTPAPAWLCDLLARPVKPTAPAPRPYTSQTPHDGGYWLDRALAGAVEGARNTRGFWLACQLRDDGMGQSDAETILANYAGHVPGTGYSEREAIQSVRSAYRTPQRGPARSQTAQPISLTRERERRQQGDKEDETADDDAPPTEESFDDAPTPIEHRTDLGNAHRFVRQHGQNVRFVAAWDHWLLWDGTRFQQDITDEVIRLAKRTVAAIYGEARDCDDHEERKALATWAMRSEAEARLRSMIALAESEAGVALAPDALDAHPWLLNTTNGVIDLQTGQRQPHDRTLLCTKRATVPYQPDAPCPLWEAFLHTVFAGDADLIAYIQRAVGYSLTTQVSEQCVFVCHGNGANGKSTFLDVLIRVLGEYAMTTPTDTLMVKNGQNIPSDVARLQAARFVSASESGDGRRLDEELIKRITGGDRMSARFMHKEWFDFWPVLKLWLAVNHEPTIRGTDNGIWRRIHLIPFSVTIPAKAQDKHLGRKLLAEGAGILAWAVRGALAWQQEGLQPPERVTQATAAYRAHMDTLGAFFDDLCVFERGASVTNKALRAAYKAWCEDTGEREQSQQRLSIALLDHQTASPVVKDRIPKEGSTIWRGVGLKSSPKQESFE